MQNNGQDTRGTKLSALAIPRELAKATALDKGEEVEFSVKDSKTLEMNKGGNKR